MTVLAIDASTDILSVALLGEGKKAEASLDIGLAHAERVIDLCEFCLSRSGTKREEIDLVACAKGPGSFTGLRIGMATAKGLALGLGKPWIAIPTLDALAWGLEWASGAVLPVIDGKKGRLYAALYARGHRMTDWLDLPLAGIAALLDTYPETLVTGPDAELFEELAAERSGIRLDRRAGRGAAASLAALAVERFAAEGASGDDEGPLYLRPSEAEEARATRS
jgi:tRNA threonylcarbamoyladenosine biosynthesis protein TsaB